ncbi:TRAP transporter small permease [Marinimicrococcus flavescens]|uniref:TRAP transporter small permease protein n=1 Tax=Marinimicrococcus flavescens TaxID=3031815 RepID=A0AAP3XSJ6_9PROT|nr:TRAP transporter small permease [Marinimicrococcus flavescens]
MKKLLDLYYRLLRFAITLSMAVLCIPVTMQIMARYFDFVPRYIWTEEIARFCFVWVIMLGAMIAVRDGTHFDLDVLPHGRSPRVEGAIRLFAHTGMLVVALIFVHYGWQFVEFGWYQTSEIFELPMTYIFIAWPVTGLTWLAFLGEKVAEDIRLLRGHALPAAGDAP